MQHIDMEKFANGAFTEQINRELKKVTENIQDPNTDATAKRRITVVIEFKPNEARNFVTTGVQAKSTLAPALHPSRRFESWCSDWLLIILFLERHLFL